MKASLTRATLPAANGGGGSPSFGRFFPSSTLGPASVGPLFTGALQMRIATILLIVALAGCAEVRKLSPLVGLENDAKAGHETGH